MDVQVLRYPGDMYEVLKWAVNRNQRPLPEKFEEWISQFMPNKAYFGHHLNVHTPLTPVVDGWVRGYPHSHVWSVDWPPDTVTCVTFLTAADEGGEFGLGGKERDDPYEFFVPEEGTTILFDATRWHGVKPIRKGTRISLLSSGMPTE